MSAEERTLELLADRAVQRLGPAELAELERRLREHPELDDDSFDLAAAAGDLALGPHTFEPLPAALRDRLLARGQELVGARGRTDVPALRRVDAAPPSAMPRTSVLPWFLAAAATLLALLGWLRDDRPRATTDVASARELLIGEAPDLVRLEWSAATDPLGVGVAGDVIWSDAKQAGFMVFKGLAANDPRIEQYQLWIFDKNQSLDTPIDGGVFDIAPGADPTVVPVVAKLGVGEGFAFAVTVEKPGGVVVSSRERLALVAGL